MKKEVPPFSVLAADYDARMIGRASHTQSDSERQSNFSQPKTSVKEVLSVALGTSDARRSTETRSDKSHQPFVLSQSPQQQSHQPSIKRLGDEDARASLDRAIKLLADTTNVQICDLKSQTVSGSSRGPEKTQTEQVSSDSKTLAAASETRREGLPNRGVHLGKGQKCDATRPDSSHQLVRRYTEDIDNERIYYQLQYAQHKYSQGLKLFNEQNFFDCLMKVSKALESFDTVEPPSANLKANLPTVYQTVKDCYVLTARCYIRLDQQKHAKECLKLILKVEPSDALALYLRGLANEMHPETAHQTLPDYQRAYQICQQEDNNKELLQVIEAKLLNYGHLLPSKKPKLSQDSAASADPPHKIRKNSSLFEIAGGSGLGLFARLKSALQKPGRLRQTVYWVITVFSIAVIVLVRKRKLLWRVFAEMLRLFQQLLNFVRRGPAV